MPPMNVVDERGSQSATRGFLFADLRGYTTYVEHHGAEAAADLLTRYRALVRAEIDRFSGAEIRTEGDSFYVVFGSVATAVRCGLAIVDAARAANEGASDAIRVGIGIHAGETVETGEGYVGQPVNIAARLCALAGPGEVLVSETVRALTQSMLPVRFAPRGRRRLKGISEPITLFSAEGTPAGEGWTTSPARRVPRRWLLGGGIVALLGVLGLAWAALDRASGALPPGTWTIGIALPATGPFADGAESLRLAAELALTDAAAIEELAGVDLVIRVEDTGTEEGFGEDPEKSAEIAEALVSDPSVVAMIGPLQSFAAEGQIPITNEGGLLHCSPSNTSPNLTKPREGALDLREAFPDRINYVRLPAAVDIEAAAGAWFAFNQLDAQRVLGIDDTEEGGSFTADAFEREFSAIGGDVVRRTLNPGADPSLLLEPLSAPNGPTAVFYGGFMFGGAAEVRRAMVEAGHADVPFLGWDAIWDGSGEQSESFIAQAGDAAAGSYVSHPSVGTVHAEFDRRYREAHGVLPEGTFHEYAAAAYACMQIILDALRQVAATNPSADELREAVRAYVADPNHEFATVLGDVSFDANGDSLQQVVSFYRVDPQAAGGSGDWAVIEHRDFGPAK